MTDAMAVMEETQKIVQDETLRQRELETKVHGGSLKLVPSFVRVQSGSDPCQEDQHVGVKQGNFISVTKGARALAT